MAPNVSLKLRDRHNAKEHIMVQEKDKQFPIIRSKKVFMKGSSSVPKGGSLVVKADSRTIVLVLVVSDDIQMTTQMSPVVVTTDIIVLVPSKLNPSNHLVVWVKSKDRVDESSS
ncbi:hypothetical protein V6N11_025749 [Hibiscus sabdariffa]|uniref:Uncharacterized protein n=1 Tax=Hibiscus sabdariffa TaxID=183260 RepID=A0ABR2SU91_9ROSI